MKKLIYYLSVFTIGFHAYSQEICPEPFFSEYIEGSSNNKAIEIYNPANVAIDLANYEVKLFSNGALMASNTLSLSGLLPSHAVYVISHASSSAEIKAVEDIQSTVANFNGNDALILLNIMTGDTLDTFGKVGVDPGFYWNVPGGTTQNHTLVRKVEVIAGHSDWEVVSGQWDVFSIDMFDSLGTHFTAHIESKISAHYAAFVDGLKVSFTNESVGDLTDYHWEFGDGKTSTDEHPIHIYEEVGDYTVSFRINSLCDIDSISGPIKTCALPDPIFAHFKTDLSVAFTGDVFGMADSYNWSFGDGETSSEEHPTHNYAEKGLYEVCLTVSNACGDSTLCLTVAVCEFPETDFSFITTFLTAVFSNEAPEIMAVYFWDFGDGTTSADESPVHTYAETGIYTVCLTMTTDCGSDTVCRTVSVCDVPTANFKVVNTGLSVNFSNNSLGDILTYFWDFGDGHTTSEESSSHTYEAAGIYTVCLITENTCGDDTYCLDIMVCETPITDFSYVEVGLTVEFINETTGGVARFLWLFGDGETSITENPTHAYKVDGAYEVCLVSENECDFTDTICQLITLNTLGLVEQTAGKLMVYPNPFLEEVNINLGDIYSNITLTVIDVNGKVVYESYAASGQFFKINFEADKGVYFLTIKTEEQLFVEKRIVK